jgi:hypothetical protein
MRYGQLVSTGIMGLIAVAFFLSVWASWYRALQLIHRQFTFLRLVNDQNDKEVNIQ